jgi:hypothetical protein
MKTLLGVRMQQVPPLPQWPLQHCESLVQAVVLPGGMQHVPLEQIWPLPVQAELGPHLHTPLEQVSPCAQAVVQFPQ